MGCVDTTLQASGIHSQVNYYHMQADSNHPLPILVRMVSVIGAGRERGSRRPVNGVRGGPGEAIGRAA